MKNELTRKQLDDITKNVFRKNRKGDFYFGDKIR